MKKPVELVPFNDRWRLEFFRLREMLLWHFKGDDIAVEHVGSTAVEGMLAKPILDVDVVIADYEVFDKVKEYLNEAGLIHVGDQGIEGREVFKKKATVEDDFMDYHLYVVPKTGLEFNRHIQFRNYLRRHPEAVAAYSDLKSQLAERYPYDREAYTQGKTAFIEEALEKAAEEMNKA